MAKSTSKKIQRVQRAGVTKRAGDRPSLAFPAGIVAILLLGSLGVYIARDSRFSADAEAPVANEDVWHTAFGVYQCDQYLTPELGASLKADDAVYTDNDERVYGGIYSTGDGLIHVHPDSEESSGANASIGFFFQNVGMLVADGQFTMPDGTVIKDGDTCGAGDEVTTDTKVKLFVWQPQASSEEDPEVISTNIGGTQFREDGQIMALALVPSDVVKIDLPPTIKALDDPNEEYGTPIEGLAELLESTPDVTDTSELIADESTTSVVPDEGVDETTSTTAG